MKRSWPAVSHYLVSLKAYDLQLDRLAVNLDRADFLRSQRKRLTKSTPIVGMKFSVKTSSCKTSNGKAYRKAQEKRRFSDSRVSDEEHLEEVVAARLAVFLLLFWIHLNF